MSNDNHEQLYNTLMSIKEDIGGLKADMKTVKEQVLLTNGRVKAHDAFINTWKGKIAIITVVLSFVGTAIWGFIKEKINL